MSRILNLVWELTFDVASSAGVMSSCLTAINDNNTNNCRFAVECRTQFAEIFIIIIYSFKSSTLSTAIRTEINNGGNFHGPIEGRQLQNTK